MKVNARPPLIAAAAAFSLLLGDGDVETAHALLLGAIEHHRATNQNVDSPLEEALHTLYRVCYFGGRAELWAPFDRLMARLEPSSDDTLSLMNATFAGRSANRRIRYGYHCVPNGT